MELMDGVTIVDRVSVESISKNAMLGIAVIIVVALVFSALAIAATDSLGVGCAIFAMIWGLSAFMIEPSSDEHYQYKCTVDSSVTIETLQEQYDIIEIKDGFVILEDKEAEDETEIESETTESVQDCCCCCNHKSTHE